MTEYPEIGQRVFVLVGQDPTEYDLATVLNRDIDGALVEFDDGCGCWELYGNLFLIEPEAGAI